MGAEERGVRLESLAGLALRLQVLAHRHHIEDGRKSTVRDLRDATPAVDVAGELGDAPDASQIFLADRLVPLGQVYRLPLFLDLPSDLEHPRRDFRHRLDERRFRLLSQQVVHLEPWKVFGECLVRAHIHRLGQLEPALCGPSDRSLGLRVPLLRRVHLRGRVDLLGHHERHEQRKGLRGQVQRRRARLVHDVERDVHHVGKQPLENVEPLEIGVEILVFEFAEDLVQRQHGDRVGRGDSDALQLCIVLGADRRQASPAPQVRLLGVKGHADFGMLAYCPAIRGHHPVENGLVDHGRGLREGHATERAHVFCVHRPGDLLLQHGERLVVLSFGCLGVLCRQFVQRRGLALGDLAVEHVPVEVFPALARGPAGDHGVIFPPGDDSSVGVVVERGGE